MNVHVVCSPEITNDRIGMIKAHLESVKGPILFKFIEMRNDPFPGTEELSFEQLFSVSDSYRHEGGLADTDFVFTLTDKSNDRFFFASLDPDNIRNGFVHAGDWEHFIPCESHLPIAFTILNIAVLGMSITEHSEISRLTHDDPIGCLNDFCENKMHVRFKLRTADICVECINSLLRNQVSTLKVEQILRLLESMREEMKYSMHFHRNFTHSRLHLNVDENLLTLVDYEGKSIMLTPKEMTFYLLFLLNPDGIRYSHLVDHRPTLRRLYIRARRITPVAYDIEHYKSIESAIRPLRRDISTVVSHIKEKFIEAIGPTFSLPYLIEGPDGDQKKISLSREYVIDYPNF